MGFTVVSFFCITAANTFADGFAGDVTGGEGGDTVTVSTAEEFKTYVESKSPYIIQVTGNIDLGSIGGRVKIRSNKTIKGISPDTTITGQLGFKDDSSNVIVKRLNITAPQGYGEGDGISVKDNISNVLITRCTFYDCADGCIDITNESDYITVSWCKFYYTTNFGHNFVNLIGSGDNHTADKGRLHVTFHHNWWDTMCVERMPSVRFGRVHVYNNYYNCPGNNYCVRSRIEAECLIENNYFNGADDPYYVYIRNPNEVPGKIRTSGNIFVNCTGRIDPGIDDIFTPSYSYTLDSAFSIPSIVQIGAGADGSDAPTSPLGFGTVLCEWWTGINGDSVCDLTSNPDFPDNPAESGQLASLETPMDCADSYGARIRGYLHPPINGSYTLWIASNESSELWLSTDGDPANASLIAEVPGWTNQRQWDKYPSDQQSSPIYLTAGQKYYIEVLYKEGLGSDNLAVAWQGPGINQQVIYGTYLSPWWSGTYGDFTGDNVINMHDLFELLELWLEDDCSKTVEMDLNGDCTINFYEFSMLAQNLQKTPPDTNAPSPTQALGVSQRWKGLAKKEIKRPSSDKSTGIYHSLTVAAQL